MTKKIIILFLIAAFALTAGAFTLRASATTASHNGQIVRMNGLSSLYYVAADGKRYVFPNENIYKSWFPDFDGVVTLSEADLTALPLGGNVLYRPGIMLVKITTDPKVYAVSKNGTLRWVKTEAIAKALYGDSWNKLVDDVPDSFFTNYTVGAAVESASAFNPQGEADAVDSIDANRNLGTATALRARTRACRVVNNARNCRADGNTDDNSDTPSASDDTDPPYITNIDVLNHGQQGYIDAGDAIVINFNEPIDPQSINSALTADGFVNSLDTNVTGAIVVNANGVVTVNDIASFDLGKVDNSGQFAVKLSLNVNAKILTVTVLSGISIKINDENFLEAKQIGGTVKDAAGNVMADDANIGTPDGTFGGAHINDGIKPYITAIKAYNDGQDDYIDTGDEITVTFSEEIDPKSINHSLDSDGSVDNVSANDTGGVIISGNGLLVITDIASFYTGDVSDSGTFDVSLALNSTGRILTITLADGDDIGLTNEDLKDTAQTGGTVEDRDGNRMDSDPKIDNPTGSFIGDSSNSDINITYIKAYNGGYVGYIDKNDKIVVTFSQPIDSQELNGENYVQPGETGGVSVDANGLLTITDILSFDVGQVEEAGQFEAGLAFSSDSKVLTITIQDGGPVKLKSEVFSKATQIGGFIVDSSGVSVMATEYNIDAPSGTFGGSSLASAPYIASINVVNSGAAGHVNINDRIVVTFSEGIDPLSLNRNLSLNSYVNNVNDSNTGGVYLGSNGILTIADIAEFSVGSVSASASYRVKLALNDIGNVLTITLTSGDDVTINYQDLSEGSQTGGIVKDTDGNEMASDPRIDDPTGSF